MLASILVLVIVFWALFMRPLAEARVNHVSQHIFSIQQVLHTMNKDEKADYFQGIQNQGVLILMTSDIDSPGSLASWPYQRIVSQGIRQKLGDSQLPIRFDFHYLENNQSNIIWIKVDINNDAYWIGYPLIASNKPLQKMFYVQLIAILFLTIFSSFIISRSIKKPLSQLVYAANELRQEKIPRLIDESGPEELKTMAITFNKMARDLKKSSDQRNLMLAGISHDLRTPLARIRLAIEILEGQIEKPLQTLLVEDVETMDAILGQFLAFADSGDNERPVQVDLNTIIQRVVDRYIQDGTAIQLKLKTLPDSSFKVIAIQRVLMNLINNAIEYGGDTITVSSEFDKGQIVLSVIDNGDGIANADLLEVKKPFWRASMSRSNPQGAGLGLSIVDKIAQWHGAKFKLLSHAEGGLHARIIFSVINP
ncbi:MAG: two-component system osmolarity sensor histidine kinase EnvZ [Pseudohongiellaceae bacterium]|jgi:two-component system osmolarity sensor histidine kinase EnvZ